MVILLPFVGSLFKAFLVASSLGFVLHTLNAFASKFEFGDLFFLLKVVSWK
jgi:hypothetical protein